MLFNSYEFIFLFMPVTLIGFFLLGRYGKGFGAGWLGLCSIFFYAWWDWRLRWGSAPACSTSAPRGNTLSAAWSPCSWATA